MTNDTKIQVYISKQKEEKIEHILTDNTQFLKDRLYLVFLISLYYKQGKFNLVQNIWFTHSLSYQTATSFHFSHAVTTSSAHWGLSSVQGVSGSVNRPVVKHTETSSSQMFYYQVPFTLLKLLKTPKSTADVTCI